MVYLVNGAVCDGLGHLKVKPIEVKQLYISDIDLPFSHSTLRPLLKILKGSARLEHISLVRCCITDTLLEELLGALRSSPSRARIRHLSLECNRLTNKALTSLALFIIQNRPPITRLNIGNCIYSLHSFSHDSAVSLLRIKSLLQPVCFEADDSGLLFMQTQRKVPSYHGNTFSTPGVCYLLENLFKASYVHSTLLLEMLNLCGTRTMMTLSLVQKLLRFNSIGYLGMDLSDFYGERLLFDSRRTLSVFLGARVVRCIDTESGLLTIDSQCMRQPDLYVYNFASSGMSKCTFPTDENKARKSPHFQIQSQTEECKTHKLDAFSAALANRGVENSVKNSDESNHQEGHIFRKSVDNSAWIVGAFQDTANDDLSRNINTVHSLQVLAAPRGQINEQKGTEEEQAEITDDDYQELITSPINATLPAYPLIDPSFDDDDSSYVAPEFVRRFLATSPINGAVEKENVHSLLSGSGSLGALRERKSLLELAELSTSGHSVEGQHPGLSESQHSAVPTTKGGMVRRRNPTQYDYALEKDKRAISLPSSVYPRAQIQKQSSPRTCMLKFMDPPVVPPDNTDEFPSLNPLPVDVRRSFIGGSRSSIVRRLLLQ